MESKKITYFIEIEPGVWSLMGTAEDVDAFMKDNLEEDDEYKIKAKYMTQTEIDALPEE